MRDWLHLPGCCGRLLAAPQGHGAALSRNLRQRPQILPLNRELPGPGRLGPAPPAMSPHAWCMVHGCLQDGARLAAPQAFIGHADAVLDVTCCGERIISAGAQDLFMVGPPSADPAQMVPIVRHVLAAGSMHGHATTQSH